ncbi:histidine phosphatase family protein [Patescibacteria group bacterium]|nr:histidine phosphatase family protein [Patescibacteria group bacterium]
MSVKITYFVHGTTADNEKNLSTGWAPGELSALGIQQAKDLGSQVANKKFDIMFCSDLKRAVDSANLGFEGKYEIAQDKRLRECNYGDFNQSNEKNVDYKKYVDTPFPNGESLKNVEDRIKDFLDFLKENYNNKHIAIMAHKAPQLALEVLTKGKTWQEAIDEDWRNTKSWQPGWEYVLE